MLPDPLKGPIAAIKFFLATPLSKSSREPCCRKPALKEYFVTKECIRLVKYKHLQRRSTKRLTHPFWQPTTQLAIFSQATRIFRVSSNLVFTEYCAVIRKRRAIYFVGQWEVWLCKTSNQYCIWVSEVLFSKMS